MVLTLSWLEAEMTARETESTKREKIKMGKAGPRVETDRKSGKEEIKQRHTTHKQRRIKQRGERQEQGAG